MDNKVLILPSVAEDVFELKDNLRAEDIEEVRACGHTPEEALMMGYIWSECYSAKVNEKTEAMFGVSFYQQPKNFGLVWFLGSNEVFKHPVTLVKAGREFVQKWLKKYTVLYNAVDARNTRHIAWLQHIGFIFTDSVNVNGFKFLNFYKTKE